MDPAAYDHWYRTPRGDWIGRRELALLLAALQPRASESVLDVGCGSGYFTRALAHRTSGTVTGVDLDPAAIAYARQQAAQRASYAVADACALPFADASFDLAVSITALCFVADERAAVRELLRVARRRVAIGLLHQGSLLWRRKGRGGGSGAYRGARWHSRRDARALFDDLGARRVRLRTAITLDSASRCARVLEALLPARLPFGAFLLLSADVDRVTPAAPAHAARTRAD